MRDSYSQFEEAKGRAYVVDHYSELHECWWEGDGWAKGQNAEAWGGASNDAKKGDERTVSTPRKMYAGAMARALTIGPKQLSRWQRSA